MGKIILLSMLSEKLTEKNQLIRKLKKLSNDNNLDITSDSSYIVLEAQASLLRELISEVGHSVTSKQSVPEQGTNDVEGLR